MADRVRMLAYAWGEPLAARSSLLGEVFTAHQAYELGMVHDLVPAEKLLDRAVAIAEQTPEDCLEQYAFTKRACQAAALRDIADLAGPLDDELPDPDDERAGPARTPALLATAQGPLGGLVRRRSHVHPARAPSWAAHAGSSRSRR